MHGYGRDCSDAEVKIAVWCLSLTYVAGTAIRIQFQITNGNGFILLGNETLHKAHQIAPDNIIVIPKRVGNLSYKRLSLPTESDPSSPGDPDSIRTYFSVVSSKITPM